MPLYSEKRGASVRERTPVSSMAFDGEYNLGPLKLITLEAMSGYGSLLRINGSFKKRTSPAGSRLGEAAGERFVEFRLAKIGYGGMTTLSIHEWNCRNGAPRF